MGSKSQIFVNFIIRAIFGMALIFFANQVLNDQGITCNVGLNGISFFVSGLLGVPGVAMLYGIVAIPFL